MLQIGYSKQLTKLKILENKFKHNVDIKIFLPLIFFHEIKVGNFEVKKTAILTFWAAANLDILGILNNSQCEIFSKFRASKKAKIAVFEPLKLQNLISRKIWLSISEILQFSHGASSELICTWFKEKTLFLAKVQILIVPEQCALWEVNL